VTWVAMWDNLVANTAYLKAQKVHATIPKDFEDICEQEPIGKTLGAKDKARQNIINKFCKADSKSFMANLTEDIKKCKAVSEKDFEEVMMGQVKEATQEILRGKPFTEYQTSPFFDRFVCAVQVKHMGQMYACKKLDQKRLKKKGGEKMALLEKKILEKVNSLFLVNLAYAFDTTTHLCLVMTLMNGGDLKYHIYHTGEIGIEMEQRPTGQSRLSDLGLAVELPNGKTITQKCNIEDRLGCKDDPRKHEFFKSINIPRLDAGLIATPWVPKPNVVYAKDTGNIWDFTEVKGVEFDVKDEKFFKEFSTGAVPIPWQQEMIDSVLFDELNDPNRKKRFSCIIKFLKKGAYCGYTLTVSFNTKCF
uniref:G protein-coupled receptor kinase 7b n=1 Tax=Sinocyclocheilus grahami TaxID=75366 RepID=A0A672QTQ1_SINGR